MVAFWLLGGFASPYAGTSFAGGDSEAHLRCILMFFAGAVSASLIDHTTGTVDPVNIRPAYILIGLILMIAAVIWIKSLGEALSM